MNKRLIALLLCLLLAGSVLSACQPKETGKDPVGENTQPPAQETTFKVTVVNQSGYIFNELYVSPIAENAWGADHLGSTNILKNNGSYEITLEKYSFDNFDIKVLDEDGDTYVFTYVPLKAGTQVTISFEDGLVANVLGADGAEAAVAGTLGSDSGSDPGDTGDVEDYTTEPFVFTIYNESSYDIYAIYMMPAYTDGEGVDILPSVLAAGENYTFEASVAGTDYEGITDWTLRVVDVDGDESASYDVFDPWLLNYVDITWDSSVGGYACGFVY